MRKALAELAKRGVTHRRESQADWSLWSHSSVDLDQWMDNRVLSQTRKGVDTGHTTSYVERHNLTIRMGNRRFARKTNAFSKMFSRHVTMMNLWALHYNFCRIHSTIKITPAMEAGLTDTLHDCEWIVELIDAMAMLPKKPGPAVGTKYRPRNARRRPKR